MTDNQTLNDLRTAADAALAEVDAEKAEKLFCELIENIKRRVGEGQKEIAAELQQLAKAIEADGRTQESFDFKQKTCALMLTMSMRSRGRAVSSTPPAPAAPEGIFRKLEGMQLGTRAFDSDVRNYETICQGTVIWRNDKAGERVTALRTATGFLLVISENADPGWTPIFVVDDLDSATGRLKQNGWTATNGPASIPASSEQLQDTSNNRIIVCKALSR